ncbi:MAG: PhnD/SsuA/transferrin family substrate-binding protein [Myxococcales bacterium]|nr:PhnD/SsuA/transferrin family substrate-binding protein [Myxococcales bacterium]
MTLRYKARLLVVVAGLLVGHEALAAKPLVVGMFCPSLAFKNTAARVRFVNRVATLISQKVGAPVSGQVFATPAVLDRRLANGAVQIVLAEPAYLAARLKRLKVVAIATSSGRSRQPWSLVTSKPMTLAQLKGKVVAIPRLGGGRSIVANYMFYGELGPKYLKLIEVPNTEAALATLRVGRSEAALIPSRSAGGLTKVLTTRSMPMPALAVLKAKVALGNGIRAAVARLVASQLGIDGWRGASGASVRVVSSRTRKTPILSPIRLHAIDLTEVLMGPRSMAWRLSNVKQVTPRLQRSIK